MNVIGYYPMTCPDCGEVLSLPITGTFAHGVYDRMQLADSATEIITRHVESAPEQHPTLFQETGQ